MGGADYREVGPFEGSPCKLRELNSQPGSAAPVFTLEQGVAGKVAAQA